MAEQETAIGQQAAFAAKFLRGTTNLAQRRRYQEDIVAAKNEAADQQDQQFDRAYNQAALNEPLKARALAMDEQRMNQSAKQFDIQESRLQKAMAIDAEALALREQLADDAYDQKILELKDAKRIRNHTMGLRKVEAELREKGIKGGTPEYGNAVMPFLEQFDHADPKLVEAIWQATRIEDNFEDVIAKQRALREQGIETRLRWTEGQNGRQSIGLSEVVEAAPPDPRKLRRELERDLDSANKRLLGATPEMRPYWSKRIKETENELLKVDSGTQPQQSSETQSAEQPAQAGGQFTVGKTYKDKNGKTAVFLGDGKWQPK